MNKFLHEFNETDTLKNQFPVLKGPVSRALARKMNRAGFSFLDRIHQEIFDSKPTIEKNAILADREALVEEFHAKTDGKPLTAKDFNIPAPELTDDYLRELGIDPNNLGSNKVPEGAKLLITDDIE